MNCVSIRNYIILVTMCEILNNFFQGMDTYLKF